MSKKILITTPIYYASGVPHIGHAYTTVLADVFAGYHKLLGNDVIFLTGTDEHGQKIFEKSIESNLSPRDFVDMISQKYVDLFKKLDIDYDVFVRTSSQSHETVVQKIFSELLKKDHIYLGNWTGLYCSGCEENYTLSSSVKKDDGLYCDVGHKLIKKSEESYFLRLSSYQNWLRDFFVSNPDFIFPKKRLTEIINNFLTPGIEDLSVSRTSMSWGIPVIENSKHVVYVWIDALMSYVTGLGFMQENNTKYKLFWENKSSEIFHFLGKEITRFHAIYWPIMLNMLDMRLPQKLISHGWIVTKEGKMSKSLGNVIDPLEYIDEYGSDALRYYLVKQLNIENDGIFSKDLFINLYNADLANNYGNFISRILGILNKQQSQIIPKIDLLTLGSIDKEVLSKLDILLSLLPKRIKDVEIDKFIGEIMEMCSFANKYIEIVKPWELIKNNNVTQLDNFLNIVFNVAKVLTFLLAPLLKSKIKEVIKQLNIPFDKITLSNINDLNFISGVKVKNSSPIFVRISEKIK